MGRHLLAQVGASAGAALRLITGMGNEQFTGPAAVIAYEIKQRHEIFP
jgi:hypothetical protein